MKNKIILALSVLVLILAVGAVSATENITDLESSEPNCDDSVVLSEGDTNASDAQDSVPVKANSTISAPKTVGYERFKTNFTVTLTSDGVNLASKQVKITINNVTYKRTTNEKGQASVNVKLENGTYKARYSFAGDENFSKSSGVSKIVVKNPLKTKIMVYDKDLNYRQGSSCAVIVKLIDEKGKALKNQNVTFRIKGKLYQAKTDSKGLAEIFVSLKKGKYKVTYYFTKNSPYLSSSSSHYIKVKKAMGKGDGYWLWSAQMKSVSLKNLASKGTKQIFLHVHAIAMYGKSSVVSFIKTAHKYKIKVHIWMQVFYNGGKWVKPLKSDGSLRYGFMKNKIALAKSYAKIKGVDGIHFDYVRFGGTAHLYNKSVDAVNYFVKKACSEIRSVNPNCIISAAIMPEPNAMHYYYGQDVPTMSKYLDVLLPMVYKGNYGKDTAWIGKVTQKFVSQSKGAQIWTGLQSYRSDDNPTRLSQSELIKDSKAAIKAGAKGIILFRIGISCNFNFNKVH